MTNTNIRLPHSAGELNEELVLLIAGHLASKPRVCCTRFALLEKWV